MVRKATVPLVLPRRTRWAFPMRWPALANGTGRNAMDDGLDRLAQALSQCEAALGADRVCCGTASEYARSTTGSTREIAAAVYPGSTEDVQTVVRISRECAVPLYPISTGRNWGYGTANPVRDGCVIVDLKHMNSIHHFDREMGTVTVGPAVTQGQLRDFLDQETADYLVPVTGAGPNCSLLGNALERGYGITPTTDHFGAVMSVEAVLPDGRLYRSPLNELGGEEVDRLFKWGIGPYIDGLFSQGNFGILTRMTIALAPAPQQVVPFFFGIRDEQALSRALPVIRQVLREFSGQVPAVNLLSRQRMLSMMAPFPEAEAEDGVLPPKVVARLAREHRIQAWNGIGAIYGSPQIVRAVRRRLRRLLRPATTRLVFVTERNLERAESFARWLPQRSAGRVRGLTDTLRATLGIMRGRPSEVALPLAYWRSGTRPEAGREMNPAHDGCGLIWYAPLVPLKAESVERYLRLVEETCPRYGLNPLITLTTLNDRCFDSTVPLLFDRTDPDAVSRAQDCYTALVAAGAKQGFLPYRLNNDAMGWLAEQAPVYSETASRLKAAIDPAQLIAPGRYIAEGDHQSRL